MAIRPERNQQQGPLSPSLSTCTPPADIFSFKLKENEFQSFQLLEELSNLKDTEVLSQHGYQKARVICEHSLQGQVFEAHRREKIQRKRYAIKKVMKRLHAQCVSMQDEMSFVVEEDIVKESLIQEWLTVTNKPPGDYIAKFVEFFEDANAFYLVMEYAGDRTLLQFVESAHRYIKYGKLALNEYQKIVKYLFWQIAVTINWLHQDMNCCHLDLCLDNVLVRNGSFVHHQDGSISINPKISCKIADFGCSEVFKCEGNFQCGKTTLTGSYQYCAPEVYQNLLYDARKADVYQLGCMLFFMAAGVPVYKYQECAIDTAFLNMVKQNEVSQLIHMYKVEHLVQQKQVQILNGMLNLNERQRCNSVQILTHSYFTKYYSKYHHRLQATSKKQKKINRQNRSKMSAFPFYCINEIDSAFLNK